MNLASIPSPTTAVWYLGPIPIRAYALCIVAGIIVASVVTEIRMRRRGAPPYAVLDVAVWAVPFGIVGARIYHVITSPDAYFGAGGDFVKAFKIWEGGLGIWGAVAGGALGAWLACRQMGMPLTFVADALAPGLPLAQAIGRLGNWFNNELYGGRTDLPWGLKIYQIDTNTGKAQTDADGNPLALPGFYQPTFLYELIWDLGVALLVWQADKRYKFGKGRAFALYVMAYTVGRAWIEAIRTDPATHVLGVRLNVWVSIVVFLGALGYFLRTRGPQEFIVPADRRFRVVTEEEFAEHQAGAAASAKGGEPGETTEAADLTDEGAEAEGEAAESEGEVAEKPDAAEKPSAAEEPDEDERARAEAATRDDR